MIDPRLIVALTEWLKARVPAVGDRVQPLAASVPDAGPFVVYHGTAHNHVLTLKGLSGKVTARVLLVVWHTDHLRACHLATKIVGRQDDPGLHGLGREAPLAYPDIDVGEEDPIPAGAVAVERCFLLPDSVQRDVAPIDGGEDRWFAVPLEFEIVYTAG